MKPSRAFALLTSLYLAFAAVLLISNTTYRKRMQDRAILADREHEYAAANSDDRYIDLGVILKIVVADENGEELLPGKPKLRVVRTHSFGGMLDTRLTPPALVAKSKAPLVWLASEDQEPILLNPDGPAAQLVEGAEGAGKTTILAQWHYLQWLAHLGEGREGLQTAPTNLRLGLVRREIRKLWRANWYRYVTRKEFVGYELCDGSAIRMVSTHRQSEAAGSPVQGFNSSWAGRDETQDQTEVHEDIESRGRAARDGIYPQLGTSTVKDTPTYRNFRGELAPSEWRIRPLLVCEAIGDDIAHLRMRTPFLTERFVQSKRASMSEREFRRRYLAELGPHELAVFYNFRRERNLVAVPRIAVDVTPAILDAYRSYLRPQRRSTLLVGHDPGNIWNTSVVLKLFLFPNPRLGPGGHMLQPIPTWLVVGELQTRQTTARQHAKQLRDYLRTTFETNIDENDTSGRAIVMCDPHGKGEAQTDYQTVYLAMQAEGIDVFNPAPMTKRIKRKPRIEMLNRLCFSPGLDVPFAAGLDPNAYDVRFAVGLDSRGQVVAPRLVDALETMVKRPGEDDPEGVQKKDEDDKTHAPAATGYALWPFEQEAITADTQRRALIAGSR